LLPPAAADLPCGLASDLSLRVAGAVDALGAAGASEDFCWGLSAAYQSFTPPWLEQAPLLVCAEVYEPSWHRPVAPAAAVSDLVAAGSDCALLFAAGVFAFPYHSLIPPCPEQAPCLVSAEVWEPSLHSPVADVEVCP